MALNFPNSPTNGQLYTDSASGNRWVWDSGNTCWVSTSTFTQTITVASTAPGSPVAGQLWWNKDYGRLLVYYTDDNTSQWVDASPSDYTSQLAYGVANAAFAKANNALANTSGTFAGDLSITGNVAVGTTSSSYPIGLGSYANGVKIALRGATNEYAIGTETNELKIASYSATTFYSGGYTGTERMRIDSSGDLLSGITSSPSLGGNPARLSLVNSAPHQLYCRGASTGYTQASIVLASATTDAPESRGLGTYLFNEGTDVTWYMGTLYASADVCGFARATGTTFNSAAGDQANYRLRVDSSGNLTILGSTATKASGTAWVNPSDSRLKRDIINYDKGLVELNNVRVRKWKFNGKGGTIDGSDAIGVIADEIMNVLPETVTEYEAKLNPDDETNTKIKKFDATEITWLLVNSVKELSAKLDEANARIAKLEGK